MCTLFPVLVGLTITLVIIGLLGNTASLLGTSWVEVEDMTSRQRVGLLQFCDYLHFKDNITCSAHRNLLHFYTFPEWDITTLLMIISCMSLFLALVSSSVLVYVRRRKKTLACFAIVTSFFSLLGGLSGLTAVVYFEAVKWYKRTSERTHHIRPYSRGWCNITAWFCSGVAVIAFVFSCGLSCLKPDNVVEDVSSDVVYRPQTTTPAPPATNYPIMHMQYGFPMQTRVKVLPT